MPANCGKHGVGVKSYRSNGRDKCAACNSAAVASRRRKIKLMAVEYKGGQCERCGYSRTVAALDFHHKEPSQKDFEISRNGHCTAWERVKEELDKCVLVCKNCHAEIHEELRL